MTQTTYQLLGAALEVPEDKKPQVLKYLEQAAQELQQEIERVKNANNNTSPTPNLPCRSHRRSKQG